MTEYPTHPIAELFPMLPDDELQELAEDIKQRGLLAPITLDSEGRIIDGRNRYAACRSAGVTPEFQTYDGPDVAGYALAANLARRHLSKGQKAMIAAQAVQFLDSVSVRTLAVQNDVSKSRISQASVVAQHAPDLAASVAAGAQPLDEAYRIAQDRKAAASSAAALLEQLARDEPDLAEKVKAGDMSLADARGAAHARSVERQRDIDAAKRAAAEIVGTFQTHVATIVGGARTGGLRLVTPEMVAGIRKAFDLLEGEL